MTWKIQTFAVGDGINLTDPALVLKPGEALTASNFEVVAGQVGYRKVDGYTKYDGHATLGDVVVAAGSGSIRGVFTSLDGSRYCWRNNAGGTALVMYKATSSGWTALTADDYITFTTGVSEVVAGDTIKDAAGVGTKTGTVSKVVVYSGDWSTGDAAGRIYLSAVTGVAWANADPIYVGATLKGACTSAKTAQVFSPSGTIEAIEHNFYGATNLRRIYFVDGVNPACESDGSKIWQIKTAMATDTPTHLAAHKSSLWLSFPGGSIQYSGVGDPLTWSVLSGAEEIGAGDDVTGLLSFKGDALIITCRDTTLAYYGDPGTTTEVVKVLSADVGAKARTLLPLQDTAFVINENGMMSIAAVQAYGNFGTASLTRKIDSVLNIEDVLFCYTHPGKGQYRFVMDDYSQWTATIEGKEPKFTRQFFGDNFTCAHTTTLSTGEVAILVGDTTGMVYKMDFGTSFAGDAIESALRLPFNKIGTPSLNKRFHKVTFDVQAVEGTTISVAPDYEYATLPTRTYTGSFSANGAVFGTALFDSSYFSDTLNPTSDFYIDGVATNIGFLIYHSSSDVDPFTINALTIYFTPRGSKR